MRQSDRDDAARLTRWVREHGRAVLGFVLTQVRDKHAADDLLQETFARAWAARRNYAEQGSGRAYLIRIADRLVQDRARRMRVRPVMDLDEQQWIRADAGDPAQPDASEMMARVEANDALDQAMKRLTDAQRRTLLMRYFGDMTFDQIAAAMHTPVNTVLSHCHRGLKALRSLLAERVT